MILCAMVPWGTAIVALIAPRFFHRPMRQSGNYFKAKAAVIYHITGTIGEFFFGTTRADQDPSPSLPFDHKSKGSGCQIAFCV